MIVTKKYINNLREKSFLNISKKQEILILKMFGEEPEPDENGHFYTFSEQDIYEGIRKILKDNVI